MGLQAQTPSQRLPWLEGVRIAAAVMILLYHAQLLMTQYAYTPQPTGWIANGRSLLAAGQGLGLSSLWAYLATPFWFGFQFVDVFVLISGFSLVLSLKGKPLQTGQFLKQRFLRILFPFWTVVWLSYPVLWLVGTLTHSYIPSVWNLFAAATFPLLFDFSGELLLPISGPWWFVSLILSFAFVFPFLWRCLQAWGARNLLWASFGITLVYRLLAAYAFGGHPTYVILDTPSNWLPFLPFPAKLSTFVVGMVLAQAYLQHRGPLLWRPGRALLVGVPLYLAGFGCQFSKPGWIVADLLVPLGLTLICMAAFKSLERFPIQTLLLRLGAHSYSFFLIHNFVVDRTLNLFVQRSVGRYYLSILGMVVATLVFAWIVDRLTPVFQIGLKTTLKAIDAALTTVPKKRRLPAPPAFDRPLQSRQAE